MKNLLRPSLSATLLVLLAAGCASVPKVSTQAKPGADLARYRTFMVLPLPQTSPAVDPGRMQRLAEPARQAVVESLMAKGLREAERASADLAVSLRGEALQKIEVSEQGYTTSGYSRWNRSLPGPVVERRYVEVREERTLTLEIFDNATKEPVWVGWAKDEARGDITPEKLQNAIRRVLAEWPVGMIPAGTK